jgi:hypothetical protein
MASNHVVPSNSMRRLRVTLTAGDPTRGDRWFLGEFEGSRVRVEVYDVADILAIRRALAEHGSAVFDSLAYRVDLVNDAPETPGDRLTAIYDATVARLRGELHATPAMTRLRTDVLNGAVGGPDDGAAA